MLNFKTDSEQESIPDEATLKNKTALSKAAWGRVVGMKLE